MCNVFFSILWWLFAVIPIWLIHYCFSFNCYRNCGCSVLRACAICYWLTHISIFEPRSLLLFCVSSRILIWRFVFLNFSYFGYAVVTQIPVCSWLVRVLGLWYKEYGFKPSSRQSLCQDLEQVHQTELLGTIESMPLGQTMKGGQYRIQCIVL